MVKGKNKTILLLSFVFSPNIGGVESHLDDLCEWLSNHGFSIIVLTYQPIISNISAKRLEKKRNVTIYRIPWIRFNLFNRLEKFPILQMLYLIPVILCFAIYYLLQNGKKIDVLQAHGFNMAFVGAVLSVLFQKKLVINTHVSFHFKKDSFYSFVLSKVLNVADSVLVLTKQAGSELSKIGVRAEKIVVYHQWIDTKLFKPYNKEKSRIKLGLPTSKFIVLFTGRFVAAKGINLLLDIAKKTDSSIIFVIVGSGPLENDIKKIAGQYKSLFFAGTVPKEDLPYYFSAANVTLIPSIQATALYAEGIPRVLVESLTCGTPLIATPAGGVKELLHEDIGFLIKPTAEDILKKITFLSSKRTSLNKMETNCITFAKKEFSKDSNATIIAKSLI